MHKNNIPLKVALGYSAIAIIMILAISLVYSNTKSINAINEASREYIQKRGAADSTISSLLKEEQRNLKQLSDVMAGRPTQNYLQNKVKNLNTGKDSILVHSKAPQTHEAKKTTVEVLKTRRGFFRRLADAFKKEHAETLSVKQDSNRAVIDSVTTPVNVAENVANILEQIDKKEKVETQDHKQSINREMEELKMVSAKLALRSAKHLSDVHQREKDNMQEAIKKAMEARKHLLWQMELLAIVAFFAIVIMIWFIWRDARKERIYRENLEAANEEIQRIMRQRERLLLTITHDIKAPAASISGFIDLMKEYVSDPKGTSCLSKIKRPRMPPEHQELCCSSFTSRCLAARLSSVGERTDEGSAYLFLTGTTGSRIGRGNEIESRRERIGDFVRMQDEGDGNFGFFGNFGFSNEEEILPC